MVLFIESKLFGQNNQKNLDFAEPVFNSVLSDNFYKNLHQRVVLIIS